MFNAWIVGALLLLLLFILATYGRGDEHITDDHKTVRQPPMKFDAEGDMENEIISLVDEKKDL